MSIEKIKSSEIAVEKIKELLMFQVEANSRLYWDAIDVVESDPNLENLDNIRLLIKLLAGEKNIIEKLEALLVSRSSAKNAAIIRIPEGTLEAARNSYQNKLREYAQPISQHPTDSVEKNKISTNAMEIPREAVIEELLSDFYDHIGHMIKTQKKYRGIKKCLEKRSAAIIDALDGMYGQLALTAYIENPEQNERIRALLKDVVESYPVRARNMVFEKLGLDIEVINKAVKKNPLFFWRK